MLTLQKSAKSKSFKLLGKYLLLPEKRLFLAAYVTSFMHEAKYLRLDQYDSFKNVVMECLCWIHDSAIAEEPMPLSEQLKEIRIGFRKPILEKAMEEVLSLLSRELHYVPELGHQFRELSNSLISQVYLESD